MLLLFIIHAVVDLDDIGFSTAVTLAFGAHSAWINAFNMTVAGYIDTGWSEVRRAGEFTCYASKVVNFQKRAQAWIKQRTDENARKLFSGTCQIPMAYTSDKYKFLRELLVAYDMANYYGAHGNLETLAGKYHYAEANGPMFSYQADREVVISVAGMMILNGYRILQSFRVILNDKLSKKDELDKLLKYVGKTIIEFRLDLAKVEYNNSIPDQITKYIIQDNRDETDKLFSELIEREKARKKIL